MRYRRDIPLNLLDQYGTQLVEEIAVHVCEHLLGAAHPEDDPRGYRPGDTPLITLYKEDELTSGHVSVIGEIDAPPNAPYLKPGFDPGADHPEIVFAPYQHPEAGQMADVNAFLRWHTHGRHERPES